MQKVLLILIITVLILIAGLSSADNATQPPPVEPCEVGHIAMVKCLVRQALGPYISSLKDNETRLDMEDDIMAAVNNADFVSVGLDKNKIYVSLRQGKRLYKLTYKADNCSYKCINLAVSDKTGI